MSSDTDALLALREAIKSGNTITYSTNDTPTSALSSATHIILSHSMTLPKSAPTRWRKPGVSTASGPSDYLSLEAVYLAWLLKDAPGAEYMKQVRENGLTVGFVSVTERKNVVDWLEGRVVEHEGIKPLSDSTTPPGTPTKGSSSLPSSIPHRSSRTAGEGSSPTKRKYVVDSYDADIVKKIKQSEIELQDRTSVLKGFKPTNFKTVKEAYETKLKKLKEAGKTGASAQTNTPDPKLQARKPKNMFPIIMISSSPTALITMYNVKKFLQDSSFEPSQEARARAAAEGNARADDLIPIYRKRTILHNKEEVEIQDRYAVVDSVEALAKFGADAWDRVVCVMTTGQTWQFKPYKWTEPTQLFHHVKGVYVTWANDPPNSKIQDWNVTSLKIEPHRRHVDKSIVAHFWKMLDSWIMANKPWLMKG